MVDILYQLNHEIILKILIFHIYTSENGKIIYRLYKIGVVPIIYHGKAKSVATPYLPEFKKYFEYRTKWSKDIAKKCRQITTFECTA